MTHFNFLSPKTKLIYWLFSFIFFLLFNANFNAQINTGERLMMPGNWNSWANYPTPGSALRSNNVNGEPGGIELITVGVRRYQTIIHAAASGGNVTGGVHPFLFTSGGGDPWYHRWNQVSVTLNTLQNYNHYAGGGGSDNSVTLTNDRWYTMNWRDNGYAGTNAIFMETSGNPVNITNVTQLPLAANVTPSDNIDVTITTASNPSAEEKFYLRYTTNNYSTSTLVEFSMTGSSGTAQIPAQSDATTVSYYVFSSTVAIGNISPNYDMCSIKINNNSNANYSYTSTALLPVDVTFQVNMNSEVISGPVQIAGTFNGFTPATMTDAGGGNYTYTIALAQNTTIEYKFLNNFVYEGNLGAPCGTGTNRTFNVSTSNVTIPLACFSSCINCVEITFQVNMNNETVGGNVYLAGSFNNYIGQVMSGPVSGVYSITRQLSAGSNVEFKYVNDVTFEGNLNAPCGSGGNRTYNVPSINSTIPLVCFGSCSNCIPQRAITFQVNMANETVGGNVYLAGSFNGFSTTANPMTNAGGGIYTTTINLFEGENITYKFVNGSNFESNLGAPCGNGNDRTYTVPNNTATIPLRCFSSCNDCPTQRQITFQVDMSNETVGGNVYLAGSFNGFSTTANPMTNAGGGLYTTTIALNEGENIIYKFINGSTFETGNSSCGVSDGFGGYNRTYTVPTNNATISVTCFNNCGSCSAANTWTSVTSGDWNNIATWNQGSVPSAGADIVISAANTVTQNIAANINSINIIAGGTLIAAENLNIADGGSVLGVLRVSSNRTLGVTGGTLNASGAGRVQLDNGSSLLHGSGTPGGGGAVTGNFRVIRQGYSGSFGYSFFSAPMENVNLSFGAARYLYNPLTGTTDPADNAFNPGWISASGTMQQARGYAIKNPGLATMNGVNPREGTTNITVQLPSAPNSPYNLIGNPFPSAISAQSFINSNGPTGSGAIGGTIFFWDDPLTNGQNYTSNDYAYWNGSGGVGGGGNTPNGNIGSCQGFFVEALINNQTVSFFNNWRNTNNSQFFDTPTHTTARLNIVNAANKYNEILIAFKEDATDGFDVLYDAKKIIANPDLSFYSKMNNEILAIQSLSMLTENKIVDLGIISTNNGLHKITLSEVQNLNSTSNIYLEDKELGLMKNLRIEAEYEFTPGFMDLNDRFAIHFSAPFELNTNISTCENTGKLSVTNPALEAVNYELKNASNLVLENGLFDDELLEINNLLPGTYTMTFTWADGYEAVESVTIDGETPFLVSTDQENITIVAGESINISATGDDYDQIYWVLDGMTVGHGANLQLTIQDEGSYSLVMVASNEDCEYHINIPVFVSANSTTNISNISGTNYLKIFPNPASESATLILDAFEDNQFLISVFDAQQRIVYSEQLEIKEKNKLHILNTSELSSGIYFVTVRSNKTIKSSKLLISK
jgi:hypothetical protein